MKRAGTSFVIVLVVIISVARGWLAPRRPFNGPPGHYNRRNRDQDVNALWNNTSLENDDAMDGDDSLAIAACTKSWPTPKKSQSSAEPPDTITNDDDRDTAKRDEIHVEQQNYEYDELELHGMYVPESRPTQAIPVSDQDHHRMKEKTN